MREISCKFSGHSVDFWCQAELDMMDAQTRGQSSAASPEPQAQDGREHARRAVLWPARLIIAGQRDVRCFVIDLASGGAKLRTEQPVAIGTVVKLRSQRFVREGRVVWAASDRIGVHFQQLLPAW
jgi:PilZ domain